MGKAAAAPAPDRNLRKREPIKYKSYDDAVEDEEDDAKAVSKRRKSAASDGDGRGRGGRGRGRGRPGRASNASLYARTLAPFPCPCDEGELAGWRESIAQLPDDAEVHMLRDLLDPARAAELDAAREEKERAAAAAAAAASAVPWPAPLPLPLPAAVGAQRREPLMGTRPPVCPVGERVASKAARRGGAQQQPG
uniref:Uncharacterized protein n=1 Tax=Emiliania huxleyi TaxID=2903 RepID=A0A7S3T129_EMIHU